MRHTLDWTGYLLVGPAGERTSRGIRAKDAGVIAYGPYRHLPAGRYRVDMGFDRRAAVKIEVESNARWLGSDSFEITPELAAAPDLAVEIRVTALRPGSRYGRPPS